MFERKQSQINFMGDPNYWIPIYQNKFYCKIFITRKGYSNNFSTAFIPVRKVFQGTFHQKTRLRNFHIKVVLLMRHLSVKHRSKRKTPCSQICSFFALQAVEPANILSVFQGAALFMTLPVTQLTMLLLTTKV